MERGVAERHGRAVVARVRRGAVRLHRDVGEADPHREGEAARAAELEAEVERRVLVVDPAEDRLDARGHAALVLREEGEVGPEEAAALERERGRDPGVPRHEDDAALQSPPDVPPRRPAEEPDASRPGGRGGSAVARSGKPPPTASPSRGEGRSGAARATAFASAASRRLASGRGSEAAAARPRIRRPRPRRRPRRGSGVRSEVEPRAPRRVTGSGQRLLAAARSGRERDEGGDGEWREAHRSSGRQPAEGAPAGTECSRAPASGRKTPEHGIPPGASARFSGITLAPWRSRPRSTTSTSASRRPTWA